MRSNQFIAWALLAVWALPWAVLGASLPYPAQAWEQFPSRQWSLQQLDPVKAYPDWDPSAFKFESYQEAEQNFGGVFSLATCQVYDPLFIAAAYYSTDGNVYIAHEPLQLQAGQRITLTWQLPPSGDAGVSRLLLLNRVLPAEEWRALLTNPLTAAGSRKHVVAEQWLGRQMPQYTQLPWETLLRSSAEPPTGFTYNTWPACRAWLQPDLSLAAKDCWIKTDCPANFYLDEYGPVGRWQLDWSDEFSLGYCLPPGPVAMAKLLLSGKVKADFTGAGEPELELACNGWRLNTPAEQAGLSGGAQQFFFDVGQYLQAGENQFSVRLSTGSGGILQLESVELWVR